MSTERNAQFGQRSVMEFGPFSEATFYVQVFWIAQLMCVFCAEASHLSGFSKEAIPPAQISQLPVRAGETHCAQAS